MRDRELRPAAFLDRDGVLNIDHGYVHRVEDFVWRSGAREALRLLNQSGRLVVVVTNQSGIGRGYYEEAHMHALHDHVAAEAAAAGARIDAWYHCPFHEEAVIERYRAKDHLWRKPNPGMLLQAMRDLPIDPARSFMIGDKESDMAAARAAGIDGYFAGKGDLAERVREILAARG